MVVRNPILFFPPSLKNSHQDEQSILINMPQWQDDSLHSKGNHQVLCGFLLIVIYYSISHDSANSVLSINLSQTNIPMIMDR